MKSDELRVEAKVDLLPTVISFATGTLTDACPMRERMHIELVAEEIFVNIASYAYAPATGPMTLRVETEAETPAVTITFIDSGVPYDPLQRPDPDLTLSAEDRPIGGLGVFLVKKIVDEAHYEYKDGKNMLTVRKVIGKGME